MVPVPEPLPGLGVFPGGSGIVDWEPNDSAGTRVMVIANDYYSLSGYERLRSARVGENKSDTFWRSLEHLLGDACVPLRSCFFTNAIMGLRCHDSVTGPSPGFRCPDFRTACTKFFVRQVEVVQPDVILALGTYAPRVMAPVCRGMESLRSWPGYSILDSRGLALLERLSIGPHEVAVHAAAMLLHPSLRPPNVWRRRFNDRTGHEAEVQLVKRAMEIASNASA